MSDIVKLTEQIVKFRDKRDWKQFHSPKDSSMALVSESVEVLDELKFKNDKQVADYLKKDKSRIGNELTDVLFWVLLMAHDLKIDIVKQFKSKMKENEKKYPVEKSKGSNIKYTDL